MSSRLSVPCRLIPVALLVYVCSGLSLAQAQGTSHVQQVTNADMSGSAHASLSATFAKPTTNGDAIVLAVTYGNANPTITVSDSQGNTYHQAIQQYDGGNFQGLAIFYATGITGGSTDSVTVRFSSSVDYLVLAAHEYSGIAFTSALDVTSGNIGRSTGAVSSGSATTAANGDLIFSAVMEDGRGYGDTYTAGSGFIKRVDAGTGLGFADEDGEQITAGLIAGTFTLSPGGSWISVTATFKTMVTASHVQQAAIVDMSGLGHTSLSATFGSPTTTGNAIIVAVTYGNANPTISVSDNQGNAYHQAIQTYDSGNHQGLAIYYATAIKGGSSTLTVNFGSSVTYLVLAAHEYTGIVGLDVTSGNIGRSTAAVSSGNATTTANGDLIFSAVMEDAHGAGDGYTAGNGFTKQVDLGACCGYADESGLQVLAGPSAGTFTLSASSSWVSVMAAFTVGAPVGSKFPIAISGSGRYFVDATGAPWLMVGDSAHHIVNVLPSSSWPTYFVSRQALGFNTVNIMSCAHGNCPSTGATADGQVAFTGTITSVCGASRIDYDLGTPNPNYWVELDNFINMAASYGLVVLFDPLTTADYINDMRASGPTKVHNFGAYLGNRYKNFPNIIWELGNDFQTWRQTAATCPGTVSDNALVQQLMAGIASADTNHIQTIQLDYPRSYSNQDSMVVPYVKADAFYTYFETYDYAMQAYHGSPVSPVFLAEANMEGANNTSMLCALADARILRRQMYWTMTSGASGHVWGNTHVNHSDATWQPQLNTPATAQVALLTNLFSQLPWWKLVPDTAHQVVTAGFGVPNVNNENLCNSTYATAAWVPDSAVPTLASAAVVYTPVATTTPLSVNMKMFSKAMNASWYDPTTGNSIAIAGSPFANSGAQSFTAPSVAHSDGTNDWVLVLR